MNLSLIIPDLLLPRAPNALLDRYHGLRLPAFERLFARGALTQNSGCTLETFLLAQFGVTDTQSVAPYTWRADGGSVDTSYWLRADPVYLQAQRSQLVLVDGAMLDITAAQADALCTTLNQHFVSDNLRFFPAHPARWYIGLDQSPALRTEPLARVAGQAVNERLPHGATAQRWNQILNEAQMLLHAHPVNEAREQQGLATINSLWLWGGGIAQSLPTGTLHSVWANDALARGLALSTQVAWHTLPQQASACLANIAPNTKSNLRSSAESWIVFDGLRRTAWYGDDDAWRAGVAQLEENWIAPLEQALYAGRINSLTLYALNDQSLLSIRIKPSGRYFFWRPRQALHHYLPSPRT